MERPSFISTSGAKTMVTPWGDVTHSLPGVARADDPTYSHRVSMADRPLTQPHPSRLPESHPAYGEILAAHEAAMAAGKAGYLDPVTGYYVMTADTHARRGFCCESGCRHCPYLV
jgi:hypothetical protein